MVHRRSLVSGWWWAILCLASACGGTDSVPTAPTFTSRTASISALTVSPAAVTLPVGKTVTLTASATYADGTTGTPSATWGTSDATVATVNSSGTVTGLSRGATRITASAGGYSASTNITVTASGTPVATVTSVSVHAAATSVKVGATTTVSATASYSDGTTSTVTPTWASSNTAIATVSSTGTVTAVAAGSVTITGTYDGRSGTVVITATAASAQPDVVIGTPTPTFPINGETITDLTPHFSVTNGTNTGTTADIGTVYYEIQVATSPSASSVLVTASTQARNSGSTRIALRPAGSSFETELDASTTYYWQVRGRNYGSKTHFFSDSTVIEVDASPWSEWQVFKTADGSTYTLTGQVTDEQNAALPGVTVQVLDGPHKGASAVTNSDGRFSLSGLSGNLNFQVRKDGYVEQRFGANRSAGAFSVVLARAFTFHVQATTSRLEIGETTIVSAEIRFSDGPDQQVYPTWTSSNPGVASVSSGGLVRAISEGEVRITGEYQGRSGYAAFEVKDEPLVAAYLRWDNDHDDPIDIGGFDNHNRPDGEWTVWAENEADGCANRVSWVLRTYKDGGGTWSTHGPMLDEVSGSWNPSKTVRARERFTIEGSGLLKTVEYGKEPDSQSIWYQPTFSWDNIYCSNAVRGPGIGATVFAPGDSSATFGQSHTEPTISASPSDGR